MSDTIYKLQQRVEGYSTEAEVYQEGDNRINIDIPGESDANEILTELGKPGSLVFMDSQGNTILTGDQVASAQGGMVDGNAGKEYVVSLTFTEEGTKAFADATTANVGNPIYIVYDNEIVSAPVAVSYTHQDVYKRQPWIPGPSTLTPGAARSGFTRPRRV